MNIQDTKNFNKWIDSQPTVVPSLTSVKKLSNEFNFDSYFNKLITVQQATEETIIAQNSKKIKEINNIVYFVNNQIRSAIKKCKSQVLIDWTEYYKNYTDSNTYKMLEKKLIKRGFHIRYLSEEFNVIIVYWDRTSLFIRKRKNKKKNKVI